tara:strand:- start:1358 stop:1840 length:483 start_codon:yes stop_codon:yes gene_type:complete
MPRQAQPIKVSVGRQRIHSGIAEKRPSEAGYAANIGMQMRAIRDRLKGVVAGIENATPDALVFALQPIFDKSQVYVPVETMRLKNSGFLETVKTMQGASAAIGYAKGGNPFYAAFVHERIWVQHKTPTRAKFLEAAVNEHISEVGPRYVSFVQGATGLKP